LPNQKPNPQAGITAKHRLRAIAFLDTCTNAITLEGVTPAQDRIRDAEPNPILRAVACAKELLDLTDPDNDAGLKPQPTISAWAQKPTKGANP